MGVPDPTMEKNGEASQTDAIKNDSQHSVEVLRRQRHQAFREVGFAEVAEHKAVNGYSTIVPSPLATGPANMNRTASDSYLSTPLIDMSKLGGNNGSGEENGPTQQQQKNLPIMLSPEAGLHRDGEQARLVEEVRRRQMQQRQYHEETTLQWLEESAFQFWESMLVYGGVIEDPRNTPIRRNPHLTMPENPYRDTSRPTLNDNLISNNKRGDTLSSSDSTKRQEDPTSQPIIDIDGHPPSHPEPFSKRPRIIRFVFLNILRVLYAFRWSVDFCMTRVAHLDPLLPAALSTHATSPVYSLQITADDILRFTIILWTAFYCGSRIQLGPGSMLVMACLLMGLVGRNAVRSVHPHGNQHQLRQQQNSNGIQPTARKDPTITTLQPVSSSLTTPQKSIASNDQLCSGEIERLQKLCPNATHAECKRYLTCVKNKEEAAFKRLGEFFKWRSDCGLSNIAKDAAVQVSRNSRVFDQTFVTRDEEDWKMAAKKAVAIITKSHDGAAKLPQIICSYEEHLEEGTDSASTNQNGRSSETPPRCKDGTRVLHILPFRLDLSIATAPTYSLAVAIYLDRRFSRSSSEKITLFCDVRGGRGWANPTPWSMLPFVQSTASLLGSHYPERLKRLVLSPMPSSAIWVWSAAQKCLDPNTASKVVVVKAAEGTDLPEGLREFIDDASLNILEERRKSFFVG